MRLLPNAGELTRLKAAIRIIRSSGSERPHGHIPNGVDLDLNTELSKESRSQFVGKDDEVVFSCHAKYCPYSAYASAKAVLWGYTRVYYFAGGFPAWKDAGYPVETSSP